MRVHLFLILHLMVGCVLAQTESSTVVPKITTVPIEEGAVTVLHLGIGYTTSVRLPEEISSVVLGNPASFKAEHSEAEPRLVFLKPITTQPAESNALITTKSGLEISLHLISARPSRRKFYGRFSGRIPPPTRCAHQFIRHRRAFSYQKWVPPYRQDQSVPLSARKSWM